MKSTSTYEAEEPARVITVKLSPRSPEVGVWVMADGALVCGCHESYMTRGRRDCRHKARVPRYGGPRLKSRRERKS